MSEEEIRPYGGTDDPETAPLLKKENLPVATTSKATWRHAILLPSLLITYFGVSMYSYILNEWTQFRMREEFNVNANIVDNFTSCSDFNKSDPLFIQHEKVQQHSAKWSMYFQLAEYTPSLFAQFLIPPLTDFYGRKFLFVLTMFSTLVKSLTITLTVNFHGSLWYIVGAAIAQGLTGTPMALFAVTFSFLADITKNNKQRAFGIVTAEASLFFSTVASAYFSGYFIQTLKLGYERTSVIALGCISVGFLMILSLPESLPKEKRTKPKPILETVKRVWDFYLSNEYRGQRRSYILLLLAFCACTMANMNRTSTETIYFLGQPFCWGPSQIGIFMTARHAAQGVIGLGSLKLFQKCLSDVYIAVISTLSSVASYVIEALANTSLLIYMVPVSGMFSFLVIPLIRSMMSSMTTPDKQGAMFAGVAAIEVMGTIFSSLSENEIYAITMSFMNGFVFLMMATFSLINMILLLAYKCLKNGSEDQIVSVQNEKRN